jgi:hypothetical protein
MRSGHTWRAEAAGPSDSEDSTGTQDLWDDVCSWGSDGTNEGTADAVSPPPKPQEPPVPDKFATHVVDFAAGQPVKFEVKIEHDTTTPRQFLWIAGLLIVATFCAFLYRGLSYLGAPYILPLIVRPQPMVDFIFPGLTLVMTTAAWRGADAVCSAILGVVLLVLVNGTMLASYRLFRNKRRTVKTARVKTTSRLIVDYEKDVDMRSLQSTNHDLKLRPKIIAAEIRERNQFGIHWKVFVEPFADRLGLRHYSDQVQKTLLPDKREIVACSLELLAALRDPLLVTSDRTFQDYCKTVEKYASSVRNINIPRLAWDTDVYTGSKKIAKLVWLRDKQASVPMFQYNGDRHPL